MGEAHCILGGTFTYVHEGHLRMLKQAGAFRRISIGLTSDHYVRRHKIYPAFSYEKRLAGLKAALSNLGFLSRSTIRMIQDEAGGADSHKEADTIIVSEETFGAALRINKARKKRGMRQLKIISVPLVFGQDLKKISCASIFEGKTGLAGRLRKPLHIQVGTENPTKLAGAAKALSRAFGKKFVVHGHAEDSRVASHPFNEETFRGAKNRAVAAWKRASKNSKPDYSLGIESGLFSRMGQELNIDITVCCVYDGREATYGTGMGFAVPNRIAIWIRREKSDLSAALEELAGVKKIGWKEGALGWFSDGVMHRREQIEAAVACAFVPRIARARRGVEY